MCTSTVTTGGKVGDAACAVFVGTLAVGSGAVVGTIAAPIISAMLAHYFVHGVDDNLCNQSEDKDTCC